MEYLGGETWQVMLVLSEGGEILECECGTSGFWGESGKGPSNRVGGRLREPRSGEVSYWIWIIPL